jgi:hypothetical protein
MRDFMYVAETKDLWREYAISNGIAHAEETPEGLLLVYNPGFHADHIGQIEDDTRFHVNLRVIGEDIEDKFIRLKTYKPQAITGVSWLEPELVTSAVRVWLGGMVYFTENIPDDLLVCTTPPVLDHVTAGLGNMVRVMTPGVWTDNPDLITYQWMRDGVPINQAITPNHTVNVLDVNHTLTCEETAKNSSGTKSALSNECVVT